MPQRPKLLRERELAELYGFKLQTLRNDRVTNQRIPFIRLGAAIFYDPNAVEAALAASSFPKPETQKRKPGAAESRARRAESEAA